MRDDFLFSAGVIDDEDRPKNHAQQPVRCLEDELLPKVDHPKCPGCGTMMIRNRDSGNHNKYGTCYPCTQKAKPWMKRTPEQLRAAERLRKHRVRKSREKAGLCLCCGNRPPLPLSSYCGQRACRGGA